MCKIYSGKIIQELEMNLCIKLSPHSIFKHEYPQLKNKTFRKVNHKIIDVEKG